MDPALLLQIVELGISEIVPAEQLIVKLKDYFTLNPDVKISMSRSSGVAGATSSGARAGRSSPSSGSTGTSIAGSSAA